jgi:hypothetical protein
MKTQTPHTPDTCPHCGASINAASLLAQRPSPARSASARRAATFPRPGRRKAEAGKSAKPAAL